MMSTETYRARELEILDDGIATFRAEADNTALPTGAREYAAGKLARDIRARDIRAREWLAAQPLYDNAREDRGLGYPIYGAAATAARRAVR